MIKSMEQKLKRIIANVLNIREDEIDDDSSMETVESWDSLKHIELVVSLEEEFEISQLSTDEIVEMISVAEIKRTLRNKGVDI
ncbi:MAG: acyl carrier protein [Thermodesulfobacteriota bacterium]